MPVLGSGVEICTSATRPSSPVVGTMIYETDTASYRWCSTTSPITWVGMIPVGTVQSFAGSTAPTGWLLCYGQSLNATSNPQYADLWSVLGTTYGGSSITAFNIPDLRGRAIGGKDDMGGSAANRITNAASGIVGTSLGASGGSQTHTLTTAQIPAHNHSVNDPGHVHYIRVNSFAGDRYITLNNSFDGAYYSIGDSASDATNSGTIVYADSRTTGISINNAGSDSNHQNMPPTIVLNYIIKY